MRENMKKNILEKGFIPEEICTNLPTGFEDVEEISSSLESYLKKMKFLQRLQSQLVNSYKSLQV